MKFLSLTILVAAFLLGFPATLFAQEMVMPKPGPELDVFKADVGTWDVEITTWSPEGEATVTRGKETNQMLGFWLLTDFHGNMMGLDFQGHGVYGYDVEKKQYIGTWVDSFSPTKMEMIGKHDKDANTMTFEGTAPGPDGNLARHVIEAQYKDDGTRVMTMHMEADDNMIKIFEMAYTKAVAD